MGTLVGRLQRTFDPAERARLGGLYAVILALNALGCGMLVIAARQYPALLGLGALAFSFGLRHAFDADHISAIDNTTRKLLQNGKKPVGVGFFFSLGHSTVVLLIALALGFAAKAVVDGVVGQGGQLRQIGGTIGATVSGAFLLLIGILNLVILLDIVGIYRRMQRGEYDRTTLEDHLITGGVLTRLFSRLFALIRESWQMYPIGFLFGLGFDTASEVALLAISAGAASQGLPVYAVLSLPLLFAGGMTLMDTTDGAFMAKAYLWAFSNPLRKLFYNLTMTGLSVFVALFIGLLELTQIVVHALGLEGGLWDAVSALNLGSLGLVIVGAFIAAWAVAFTLFKVRRVEERWTVRIQS